MLGVTSIGDPVSICVSAIPEADLAVAASTGGLQFNAISSRKINFFTAAQVDPSQTSVFHLTTEVIDTPGAIFTSRHTIRIIYPTLG